MGIAQAIILLATGTVAGFAGGLLGLGGAFIMTPMQFMVFTQMGIPTDMAIKLAFGTNLMVIIPTAISGVWRHSRKKAVLWKAAITMGICGTVVAVGGATLATRLPGPPLKIAFGVIILLSTLRMLIAGDLPVDTEPETRSWVLAAWSIPVGAMTGTFGVGGGILMIPVMTLVLRFKMHNAVATSLAVMTFTAVGGLIGYIANGISVPDLPPYSIGYVNLPSWALLTLTSVGMAQLGAVTAHRIPAKQLRYVFTALVFYMGLRMIGVFEWLNLPL
ncbi:MAG: sulfite exporter TauE/SafE family protein [Chloroflexi bacterium]|nr:sulfite exporter TauE/SafE family protein [Chloroflexota bacterium]